MKKGAVKWLLVFMLTTLAVALGGCAGDKEGDGQSCRSMSIRREIKPSRK